MTCRKIVDSNGNTLFVNSNGQLHNLDGPAGIFQSGSELVEVWMLEGKRHCEIGPAVKITDEGGIILEEYFLRGDYVSARQFTKCLEDLRIDRIRKTKVMQAILNPAKRKKK